MSTPDPHPHELDLTAAAEGVDDLSYEAARTELEQVVRRLEAGGTSLEESLQLWERGTALVQLCQARLDGARARLGSAAPGGEGPQD